jgi:hypothetical protein
LVWENEKSFQFGIDEGLLPRAKGRCLSGTLSALPAPFVGNFPEIFEKQNGGRRFGFRLVFKVAGGSLPFQHFGFSGMGKHGDQKHGFISFKK